MPLKEQEWFFESHHPGSSIHALLWQEETPPKAVVQIVHGMCEYGGRYREFAAFLAAHGYAVAAADTLGHGQSAAKKEDLGYLAKRDGWKLAVADTHRLTEALRQRFAGTPVFLLGHSFGSMLSRAYLSRWGGELQGALLCGTSGSNPLAGLGLVGARLVIALRGGRYRSRWLQQMAFGGYNRRYVPQRTGFDWLSRDTAVVDRYIADPYCHFVFTASGFLDLAQVLHVVSSRAWYRSVPKRLPCLLFSGEMDPVGNYGRGVREVARRLQRAGVQEVTLRLFPQDRHELLNELDRQEVYQMVLDWLQAHLPANPA